MGRAELLSVVAIACHDSDTLRQGLESTLPTICRSLGWTSATAYFPDLHAPRGLRILRAQEDEPPFEPELHLAKLPEVVRRVLGNGSPEIDFDRATRLRGGESEQHPSEGALFYPVLYRGKVILVLECWARTRIRLDRGLQDLLQEISAQFARLAERERFRKDIIEAATARETEICEELHDNLGQELNALRYELELHVEQLQENAPGVVERALRMRDRVQSILRSTTNLAQGIAIVPASPEGLQSALLGLAQRTGQVSHMSCSYRQIGDVSLDDRTVVHLLRIAQEAVTNALKHSHAHEISIVLEARDGVTQLHVEDDGCGIEPDRGKRDRGLGFRNMTHRASLIGATLSAERKGGGGTVITCNVPQRH